MKTKTIIKTFLLLSALLMGVGTAWGTSHTVTFYVNGNVLSTAEVEEGAAITFPDVSVPTGYSFRGWTKTEITGTQSSAPEDLLTTDNMGNADVDYYAVYAKVSKETITDVLNRDFTGIKDDYSSWKDKTGNSGAVYAGKSAGGNSSIQLNKSKYAGFFSSTSGGKVKKVTVTWNGNTTEGRTLYIYGKNNAYSTQNIGNSLSDIYSSYASIRGTYLGSIVKGTSTGLTISGDYSYIGIRPYNEDAAMYLTSVSIEWEKNNYSDYCTTISQLTANISTAGWATYAPAFPVSFSTGTTAYIVKPVSGNTAEVALEKVTDVPAGTPVLLNGAAGTHTMNVETSSSTSTTGNLLNMSTGTNPEGDMYVLAKVDNVVGFYLWDKTNNNNLPAGKIYLQLPSSQQARPFIALPGEETGIGCLTTTLSEGEKACYDLQGRRVLQPTKGLYIVNGRKVVIK